LCSGKYEADIYPGYHLKGGTRVGFKRLKISNYKNIIEAEIDFTQGNIVPERNVILIGGMNGAGKVFK